MCFYAITASAVYTPSNLTPPDCSEKIIYGQSGADRDLTAYRFGEGKNVMVLVFSMHGFEDSWAHDGEALVYTASLLMQELEDHLDLVNHRGWSVYVLPCANPDGLIDGASCYGPGRCTTTYLDGNGVLSKNRGIDMNRSFPVKWTPYSSYRNFNGSAPLASMESLALADFMEAVRGDQVNICIDTHGWLTQTLTSNGASSLLFKTFQQAFPRNTWANCNSGNGYFTAYTASLGYTSCLFEFPWGHYSLSSFQKSGNAEAYCSCILELLDGYGSVCNHDCSSMQFRDVSLNAWYHHAIDYAVENGIMIGTGDDTFSPNKALTRSMLVTTLWRLAGEPGHTTEHPGFSDVKPGEWYTDAICWAWENEIIYGYDADTFGTSDPITRQDLAVLLYRFAQYQDRDTSAVLPLDSYTDRTQVSSYAEAAIKWSCGEGLMQGTTSSTLEPHSGATRAQTATLLMRYHQENSTMAPCLYTSASAPQVEPIYYDDSADPGGN